MQGWSQDGGSNSGGSYALIEYVAAIAVAFAVTYAATPPLIRYLKARDMCVPDVNKRNSPPVARPGGPVLLAGIAAGIIIIYWHTGAVSVLAVLGTVAAAFAIGYVDDRRVMGGWFKPVLLCASALPILAYGSYDTVLLFPPFGAVQIPVLYIGVVISIVVLTGNTVNSIDVVNGAASGYMSIASGALAVVLAMLGKIDALILCLVLLAVCVAFYRYHRLPSRIFPGDSGALVMGVMYGCVAITGGVEVVAAVALLPAVANSFFFLSSVRRIIEHRQIKYPSVIRDDDLRLRDSGDSRAPITLVRLILRNGPMSEGEVATSILRLGVFAGGLAVLTGILMLAAPILR